MGFRFIKFQPNEYAIKFKKGIAVKEGAGISFYYNTRTNSLVKIPVGSEESDYIFEEITFDFQTITIQGQVTYRVDDPLKLSSMMNYSLDKKGEIYTSDDPLKLFQRISGVVRVLAKKTVSEMPIKEALRSSEKLANNIITGIKKNEEMKSLGIEVLGLSILAIKPAPETGKALEAEARELIQQQADDAIYNRRNASVEQERIIKENELNTQIAIENKNREIQETQMNAQRMVQEKEQEMKAEEMRFSIEQEEKNKELTRLKNENARMEADAKAYEMSAVMKALEGVSPNIITALSNMGMDSGKLIALAFQEMAGKADKIGQLNVTPDLLKELMEQNNQQWNG